MTRVRGRVAPLTLLLVVVAAVAAGLLAGLVPGRGEPHPPVDLREASIASAAASEPGDRVREAVAGLRRTGFYMGPELRGRLSASEVAAIERLVAGAPVPVYVVWWAETSDAGYNTAYAALDQLRAEIDRPGYYAVVTEGSNPIIGAVGYEDPYVDADTVGRPGPALERFVGALAQVPPERPPAGGTGDSDYYGGAGGGLLAGLLFAGGIYLALLLVVGVTGVVVTGRRVEE